MTMILIALLLTTSLFSVTAIALDSLRARQTARIAVPGMQSKRR